MKHNSQKNIILMWMRSTLYASSTALASVSVLTAFFLRCGMTDGQISLYLSLSQMVNLTVSLIFSGAAAKFRDSRRISALFYALAGLITALFILLCAEGGDTPGYLPAVMLLGSLLAAASAMTAIFDYKLPCEVMDLRHYSDYIAYGGLFSGGVGLLIGMVLPRLFGRFDFFAVNAGIFAASALCLWLSALSILRMTPLENAPSPSEKRHSGVHPLRDLLRLMSNRDFRVLLLPNLIRGFGAGIISMITVIAVRGQALTEGNVSMITTATCLGTFFSCFLYTLLVRRAGIPRTGVIGGTIFSLICLSLTGGEIRFLVIYCIAYTGYNLVCNALPDMVYRSVPGEIISSFHTWRLALTSLGTAISTALYGALLDSVPEVILLIMGAAGILLCALGYFRLYDRTLTPGKEKKGSTCVDP